MLLALLACEPGTITIDEDKGGMGDTDGVDGIDTSSDTGGDTSGDTSDTSDTGEPAASLCGNLAGISEVGTRWEYAYAYGGGGGYTYTREREVTDIDGDRVIVEDATISGSANYSTTMTTTYDYQCDESGWWLLGAQVLQVSVNNGNETTYGYDIGYADPVQLAPREAEFGSTWQSVYDGWYEYDNGMQTQFNYSYLNTVVGEEPMEFEIGEVDVLRVMVEMNGGSGSSYYYGDNIGLVKDMQWEIVDYDP